MSEAKKSKSGLAPDSPDLEDLLLGASRFERAGISRTHDRASIHRRCSKAPGPISAGCAKSATLSPEESFRASAWKYCRWACRTISKLPSKKARPAYGWERPFSESAPSHDDCRARQAACILRLLSIYTALREMIPISENDTGVTFAIKVHPRAKKAAITGELGDALKVSLTAPPLEGRANDACIEFFAKLLKVPRSSITIASGAGSRNKVIRVAGRDGSVRARPSARVTLRPQIQEPF